MTNGDQSEVRETEFSFSPCFFFSLGCKRTSRIIVTSCKAHAQVKFQKGAGGTSWQQTIHAVKNLNPFRHPYTIKQLFPSRRLHLYVSSCELLYQAVSLWRLFSYQTSSKDSKRLKKTKLLQNQGTMFYVYFNRRF